jgi:hypothetical protein
MLVGFFEPEDEVGEDGDEKCRADKQRPKEGVCQLAFSCCRRS